ncbi:hypothetical protein F5B17DRAFT_24037 [Nemania serpens]|nr:hypothetical protein F5B17DRAFT_24037 [Nemania serpens]
MKNFGAILIALAASASLIAALPASSAKTHGIEARAPMFYAQHIHEARDRQRGQGSLGNGTLIANGTLTTNPANNGTASGNGNGKGRGNGRGNGNGRGRKGKGQDNGRGKGNNGNGNKNDDGLLEALLALFGDAPGGQGQGKGKGQGQGQKAAGAAAGNNDPLAILQGLLNKADAQGRRLVV